MEEMGLAGQIGQETPAGMGPGSKMDPMVAINEVVAMLEQGMTPEELAEAGVPMEVIEAALDMLLQKNQAPQGDGLAAMQMDQGMVAGSDPRMM